MGPYAYNLNFSKENHTIIGMKKRTQKSPNLMMLKWTQIDRKYIIMNF